MGWVTTIRTTCPNCGEVDMGPQDIVLSLRQDADGNGTYSFQCPECTQDVEKDADRKIVQLLVSAGVTVAAPSEKVATEPGQDDGQRVPFSLDDLIELHFELEDPRALERFLQDV